MNTDRLERRIESLLKKREYVDRQHEECSWKLDDMEEEYQNIDERDIPPGIQDKFERFWTICARHEENYERLTRIIIHLRKKLVVAQHKQYEWKNKRRIRPKYLFR